MARASTLERFEDKIFYGLDGCWYWLGHLSDGGYGRIGVLIDGKYGVRRAHRVAYSLFKGAVPDGMLVCHTCDNPSCVNPDHLFLGTNTDNMRDMIQKGRARYVAGSKAARSKLTESQVIVIRSLKGKFGPSVIGRMYGVYHSTITSIWNRDNWKHI